MNRFHLLLSLSLLSVISPVVFSLDDGALIAKQTPEEYFQILFKVKKVTTEQDFLVRTDALLQTEIDRVFASDSPQDRQKLLNFVIEPDRFSRPGSLPVAHGQAGEMLNAWSRIQTDPAPLRQCFNRHPDAKYLRLLAEASLPQPRNKPSNELKSALLAAAQADPGNLIAARLICREIRDRDPVFSAEELKTLKINPWLKCMLSGRSYLKQGWNARGGGFADTVTPQGWKDFFANVDKARQEFVAAWELEPAIPEAAAELIEISVIGEKKEEKRLWLKRAVENQIDYGPAFQNYLFYSRPRWGGSLKEPLIMMNAALSAEIPGSTLPLVALAAQRTFLDETPLVTNWAFYNLPQCSEPMLQALEKLDGDPNIRIPQRRYLTGSRVAIAMLAGKIDQAVELNAKLDDDDYPGNNQCFPVAPFHYFKMNELLPALMKQPDLPKFRTALINNDLNTANAMLRKWIPETTDRSQKTALLRLYGGLNSGLPSYRLKRDLSILSRLIERNEDGKLDALILEMIDLGVELTVKDGYGYCPLMFAAKAENPEFLKRMLKAGANLEQPYTNNGMTILMLCLSKNRKVAPERIRLLLEAGANVNLITKDQFKPIHYAACFGTPEFLKLLLEFGADINSASYNKTPLDMAVEIKNQSAVEFLQNNGGKTFAELKK